MARQSPLQQLKEAKQLARAHGLFVVEKRGRYLLYREQHPRNVFVGSRESPEGIRDLVRKVTTIHQPTPAGTMPATTAR